MPRPQAPAGFVTIAPGIYISLAPVHVAALQPNDSAPKYVSFHVHNTCLMVVFPQCDPHLWLECVDKCHIQV